MPVGKIMFLEKKPIKTLVVTTGYSCNNKCLMCSIEKKECAFPNRSFSDIEGDLKTGRIEGITEIEFTGGEPTIRRNIVDNIARAKALGYERISLSTNGRLFSYQDFCDKLINAGLNKVTISLLGPNEKIHNAITRTPFSFSETVKGIENLKKIDNFQVNISSVISSLNYQNMLEFGEFVLSLGVKNWYLLDLIPEGSALKHYAKLAVTKNELSLELNKLETIADKFNELGFFDFPFCLFESKMINSTKINYVNTKKRGETTQQVGFNPERIIQTADGLYSDELRTQIKVCSSCRFSDRCGGVWREYLKKFGEEETNDLAKKHNCLI